MTCGGSFGIDGFMDGDVNEDYYAILNLDYDCTDVDIKNAYKKFSKCFHPDKHSSSLLSEDAQNAFARINKAYSVLSNKLKRKLYDEERLNKNDNNLALVPYKINDFATYDILDERKRLLKEIEYMKSFETTGVTKIKLYMQDLFDPADPEDSIIQRLLTSEVSDMTFNQSMQFALSPSNVIKFECYSNNSNGMGSGTFTTCLQHMLSPTSYIAAGIGVGEGAKLSLSCGKLFFNNTSCNIHLIGSQNKALLALGYQIDVTHVISPKFQASIVAKESFPPTLGFKLNYDSHEKVSSSLWTTVGVRKLMYGLSFFYNFSEKIKLGLSALMENQSPTCLYSLNWTVDKINTVYGSMNFSVSNGMILKLKYKRQKQTFIFPIVLTSHFSLFAAVGGTLLGITVAAACDLFFNKTLKLWDKNSADSNSQVDIYANYYKQKFEAMATVNLMKSQYDKVLDIEEKKQGLIIVNAIFGPLKNYNADSIPDDDCADVKIPLQVLVSDSKLLMKGGSKFSLPGFYPLKTNKPIYLLILYKFRGKLHKVVYAENSSVAIPKPCHLIK